MISIPYGRQDISEEDIAAVVAVLRSDWLTQGPTVGRFEQTVANYVGARYACAVNSATSALHLACRAVGLGPGDTLWTVPNTFVASANAALYCGASIDFVDIDPGTYNMAVAALAEKLAVAEGQGKLPKVVMPVHFAGQSCALREIATLAKRYGFRIIEDAAHAIGGDYASRKVGSCTYSDITVFSFHPVKIVTTGEGGLLVTNNPALHESSMLLRSHGITRNPALMDRPAEGAWYYQQVELGYNYRMTDIQAALGISQMQRIDPFVEGRRRIADRYDAALSSLPVRIPQRSPDSESAWHLYAIQIDPSRTSHSRKEVFDTLRAAGIQANVHYSPVHLNPYYRQFGFAPGDFPVAENYYQCAITLPLYPGLDSQQIDHIVATMRDSFD